MKSYFAYIRVSTTRQGEEGVSLQEQRAAILEYASKRGITIAQWFEEQVSAAKRGRPVFTKLVGLLKSKRAGGIIIHKIDRGARNLRDWADMADLMDRGIEVHFAHESIDLHTRSGRLSADILAVVASDYIRNLREETIKGINGRLRQGLFPFSAPVGYLNTGKGKVKTVDPIRGPFVKQAFELYATRQYSLQALEDEMFKRGFRTRTGKIIYLSQLATILRNPFYMGLIRLKNRSEMYPGIHVPLIDSSLYNQVQFIIDHKRSKYRQPHQHLFSSLLYCEHCGLHLVGESQKGHVYYRCHRKLCPKTCIREERFEAAIAEELKRINLSPEEEPIVTEILLDFKKRVTEVTQKLRRDVQDELSHIQDSIRTLLQKFLDNAVPKETFDEGHASLLMQRKLCEEKLRSLDAEQDIHARTEEFFNVLRTVCQSFSAGTASQRRTLMGQMFVKISTNGSSAINLAFVPLLEQIAAREKTRDGWAKLLPIIIKEMALNMNSGSIVPHPY
jgi:DNA invertase Pin-like site-specific DNA recombinase